MLARKYDLEERLIDYSCKMIDIVEALPNTRTGNYISAQLVRACNSPAFNYGEAQAAESVKDFVHKMGVILKEIKECRVVLKIITKKILISPTEKVKVASLETEELIAIFGKSISTAERNNKLYTTAKIRMVNR